MPVVPVYTPTRAKASSSPFGRKLWLSNIMDQAMSYRDLPLASRQERLLQGLKSLYRFALGRLAPGGPRALSRDHRDLLMLDSLSAPGGPFSADKAVPA